jgi:flagellar biosynthetic protein FliP
MLRYLLRIFAALLLFVVTVHPVAQTSNAFWVHSLRSNRTLPAVQSHIKVAKYLPSRTKPMSEKASPSIQTQKQDVVSNNRSIAEELAIGKSSPWAVVVGLTLLTLVPAILLAMTPLIRLLVVFHFLRQALGTQTAPSNQVLMALGLMMTWFLMQPVITQVNDVAIAPYRAGTMSGEDAIRKGTVPVKIFMLRYARDKDLELFTAASQTQRMTQREDAPMQVVVPAYMLSELKSGFQIGAILFLPFLLVDLVVASVTTSVGMLQMPPTVISTPVKILLFVMVDGWHLLASSLLKSF